MDRPTPQKDVEKKCCLCQSTTIKHLTNLRSKENTVVRTVFNECLQKNLTNDDIRDLYICQTCWRKLQRFVQFKKDALCTFANVLSTIQRRKRLRKTPGSGGKGDRPRKLSTVEWLSRSVEKLRLCASVGSSASADASGQAGPGSRKRLGFEGEPYPGEATEVTGSGIEGSGIEGITSLLKDSHDHPYAAAEIGIETNERNLAKETLHSCQISTEDPKLSGSDCQEIKNYLTNNTTFEVSKLTFLVAKCKTLYKGMQQYLLKDIESKLRTKFKRNQSVLFSKETKHLLNDNLFSCIFLEMHEHVPFLLDVLSLGFHGETDAKVTMVATVFGMMMQSRYLQASAVQRVYSALCIRYHADNQLLNKLNSIHLTLGEKSKGTLIGSFGEYAAETIIKKIRAGSDGKINGDNLDFRVSTNDMRLNARDKDFHFFASDWTPDRVELSHLQDHTPCGDVDNVSVANFIVCNDELKKFKEDLKILVGRHLVDTFPCFKWMNMLLPKHIHHDHSAAMSSKSFPCMMPVTLKNEAKYSDCVDILSSYEEQAKSWYQQAGRGAKLLRAGAHTKEERFENLTPMIVELFHVTQDFLQKLCKKFLKINKGREKGTLANLRVVLQRVNVNGQVKVRFKAHEDFVLTVGDALVTELILEHFGMEDKGSTPTVNKLPDNIAMFEKPRRQKAFDDIMEKLLNNHLSEFQIQENTLGQTDGFGEELSLVVGQQELTVKGVIDVPTASTGFYITVGGQLQLIKVPLHLLKDGKQIMIMVPGTGQTIKVKTKPLAPDDLRNYSLNFLQWYFVLKSFKDAIKEGDIQRTAICLKLMVPFFYSHSKLSKYLVECLDFILKTEVLLTPRMSLKVSAGSFINRKGKQGKNKPADMEKENQVKFLKDLIRGMGKGKTEAGIIRMSKAGPVLLDLVQNFDDMAGIKEIPSTHKTKSSKEDLDALYEHLRQQRPFRYTSGRRLDSFRNITADPFQVIDKEQFSSHVMSTVQRLKRNQPVEVEEEQDEPQA